MMKPHTLKGILFKGHVWAPEFKGMMQGRLLGGGCPRSLWYTETGFMTALSYDLSSYQ